MRCHLVPVGVARRLLPAYTALKQTLNSLLANLPSVAKFKYAQFSVQCLEVSRSSSQPLSVAAVLCVQRLNLRLSASVGVVCEAEAMTSASSNAMKVRKPEPAEIEYKNMKFLITYRPTDATMDRFIEVSLLLLSFD